MTALELKHWLLTAKRLGPEGDTPNPRKRIILDYAMVLPLLLVAFGLCYVLRPIVHGGPLFTIYVLASLGAAWHGGLGPGIACLVGGLLMGDFFFIEPLYQFGPNTPESVALLVLNACAGCIGLAAIVNQQRARYREQQVRSLAKELETEVEEHRKTLEDLTRAKSQLDQYAKALEERVTERTSELRESVRSLEGVLYHVAHDLRSPLRSLSGFTELLMESLGPRLNADEKVSMEKIISSAARMDRLILDLLAYGKLAHAKPAFRETNLDELVSTLLDKLNKKIEAKHAMVEVSRPLPTVRTDPHLINNAIVELLGNSLEFTKPGVEPQISIWTESSGSCVRLYVKDNGIGIDAAHQKRIFQVFERLHPREESSGTGIGLAIVAKIVDRLGGKAGVESELGKGTRFWLELPQA